MKFIPGFIILILIFIQRTYYCLNKEIKNDSKNETKLALDSSMEQYLNSFVKLLKNNHVYHKRRKSNNIKEKFIKLISNLNAIETHKKDYANNSTQNLAFNNHDQNLFNRYSISPKTNEPKFDRNQTHFFNDTSLIINSNNSCLNSSSLLTNNTNKYINKINKNEIEIDQDPIMAKLKELKSLTKTINKIVEKEHINEEKENMSDKNNIKNNKLKEKNNRIEKINEGINFHENGEYFQKAISESNHFNEILEKTKILLNIL